MAFLLKKKPPAFQKRALPHHLQQVYMPNVGKNGQLLLFSQHDSCQMQSWLCLVGCRNSSVEWQVKCWGQWHCYHFTASETENSKLLLQIHLPVGCCSSLSQMKLGMWCRRIQECVNFLRSILLVLLLSGHVFNVIWSISLTSLMTFSFVITLCNWTWEREIVLKGVCDKGLVMHDQ